MSTAATLQKHLLKAIQENDSSSILDILSRMRSDVTDKDLESAKLRLVVQKLIKHKDEGVVSSAKLTISKWDKEVPKVVETKSKPQIRQPKSCSKRQKMEKIFTLAIQKNVTVSKERAEELGQEIEEQLFEKYGNTDAEYLKSLRELSASLRNKENAELVKSIIYGEITGKELVNMSTEDLTSDAQKARASSYKQEIFDAAQQIGNLGTESDMFTCGKCKNSRVIIERQLQTRSADEPMTMYLMCSVCKHRWKE